MFAEFLHSVGDTANQVIVAICMHLSYKVNTNFFFWISTPTSQNVAEALFFNSRSQTVESRDFGARLRTALGFFRSRFTSPSAGFFGEATARAERDPKISEAVQSRADESRVFAVCDRESQNSTSDTTTPYYFVTETNDRSSLRIHESEIRVGYYSWNSDFVCWGRSVCLPRNRRFNTSTCSYKCNMGKNFGECSLSVFWVEFSLFVLFHPPNFTLNNDYQRHV